MRLLSEIVISLFKAIDTERKNTIHRSDWLATRFCIIQAKDLLSILAGFDFIKESADEDCLVEMSISMINEAQYCYMRGDKEESKDKNLFSLFVNDVIKIIEPRSKKGAYYVAAKFFENIETTTRVALELQDYSQLYHSINQYRS